MAATVVDGAINEVGLRGLLGYSARTAIVRFPQLKFIEVT